MKLSWEHVLGYGNVDADIKHIRGAQGATVVSLIVAGGWADGSTWSDVSWASAEVGDGS